MPSLTLKNVPQELHERLREAAAQNHRSLNGEVIARLEAQFDIERRARIARTEMEKLRRRLPKQDHRLVDAMKRAGRA